MHSTDGVHETFVVIIYGKADAMPVRLGCLLVMLGLVCGCRSRNLEVEITNNTPDRVEMIALVPYQITGLFSDQPSLLQLYRDAECHALVLEPGQTWSSAVARNADRVHRDVGGGAGVGWPYLMLRQQGHDAPAWQDFWIESTSLEPMRMLIGPAEVGVGVQAFDHAGQALRVELQTPEYAREWLSPGHTVLPEQLNAVDILDTREQGLPLKLALPARDR